MTWWQWGLLPLGWLLYWGLCLLIIITIRPYDWLMRWDHQTWTRRNVNSEGNPEWRMKDLGEA